MSNDAFKKRTKKGRRSGGSAAAFTLIELAVVIATLAVVAVMLLPALANTKTSSQAIQCMNNLRQFTMGWRMYADDNGDRVVNNFSVAAVQTEIANGTFQNWANNVMGWSAVPGAINGSTTNLDYIRQGIMYPYVPSVTIYKCPVDNYLSAAQLAAGWTSRIRSISMNASFGPTSRNTSAAWASGRNQVVSSQRQWLKISEVPRPAGYFVMIEEHPDSINDGYFHNPPRPSIAWDDLPASYHEGACNLTFVDGHSETHRWRSSRTRAPVTRGAGGKPAPSVANDPDATADLQWVQARSSVPF